MLARLQAALDKAVALRERSTSYLLSKFTDWALSKNAPGGYAGEDDKRWAYTIETNGDPYLTRVLLPRIRIPSLGIDFRPMLHHFHRPDADRHTHSHPWTWAKSLLLTGSYIETRRAPGHMVWNNFVGEFDPPTETKSVTRFNSLTGDDYHKVDNLIGEVWTFFVTGPHVKDWGFFVNGEHVPWKQYLGVECDA